MLKRTVAGKSLPKGQEHLVPSRITDQGIRRRNKKKKAEAGRVRVTGRYEKQVQAFADAADGKIHPWQGTNPALEAKERALRVLGKKDREVRIRGLSDRVIAKRGMRGFEFVKDAKGNPVKLGDLTMGYMSEDLAQQRDAHYQEEGNAALRDAQDQYEETAGRVIRAAQASGLSPLRSGTVLRDVGDRTRVATVGLRSIRGNSAEA